MIYFDEIHMVRGGGGGGGGAFSERGMLRDAVYRSEDAPVLTMYLYELFNYWLPNLYLACVECLFETTRCYKSIPDMKYSW